MTSAVSRGLCRFVKMASSNQLGFIFVVVGSWQNCFARFTTRTLRFVKSYLRKLSQDATWAGFTAGNVSVNWLTNVEAGASESDFIARMAWGLTKSFSSYSNTGQTAHVHCVIICQNLNLWTKDHK